MLNTMTLLENRSGSTMLVPPMLMLRQQTTQPSVSPVLDEIPLDGSFLQNIKVGAPEQWLVARYGKFKR